ncbi:unnamed protein product [Nesidiocoris tenuis]|uniref:Uncharacterized protein n=2 Tax=Nesidiocoris tenuis TaxID=355587 RepID=A0A6H5GH50_9HEMI|nr:Hypothetical protein NTJ_16289 [Nesidiocoris tenuis]CAA9999343.1 unnamed protein product [Nesidiocoris tenuis]CAB0002938.1 unnamed protein product [Nesidiocoris tenuis]
MNPSQIIVIVSTVICFVEGGFNRCFQCRSRGELGSCKDPFVHNNASALTEEVGVKTVPCTSGWCGKILDRGSNAFKDEEYGSATERLCLQRGPNDNEERCAQTIWSHSKVFMCFCQGDLCNGSSNVTPSAAMISSIFSLLLMLSLRQ